MMDEQDDELMKNYSVYWVRWLHPHLDDVKTRPMSRCKFWPDVWTKQANGSLGHEQAVRPSRVNKKLAEDRTLLWRSEQVSLTNDLIVGTFDFSIERLAMQAPRQRAVSEENHIDNVYWDILEHRAPEFGLDTSSLHHVPSA